MFPQCQEDRCSLPAVGTAFTSSAFLCQDTQLLLFYSLSPVWHNNVPQYTSVFSFMWIWLKHKKHMLNISSVQYDIYGLNICWWRTDISQALTTTFYRPDLDIDSCSSETWGSCNYFHPPNEFLTSPHPTHGLPLLPYLFSSVLCIFKFECIMGDVSVILW